MLMWCLNDGRKTASAAEEPLRYPGLQAPPCKASDVSGSGLSEETVFKGVKIQFDPAAYAFSSPMCFR